jgi:hypothetical protein
MLEDVLQVGSIYNNTAVKEIARSTLSTEQKLMLTTKFKNIRIRNKVIRARLMKRYTKDFLRLREEELNKDEVMHRLSNKRTCGQEDKHSHDQCPEVTTTHQSEDQQFKAEEDRESSNGSTKWKDMSPDVEVKGEEPQSADEAEGLEHQTEKTRLFVEKDSEATVAPPIEQGNTTTAEVTYPCHLCVVDPSVSAANQSKLYKWAELRPHTSDVHSEYLKRSEGSYTR